MALHTDLYGFHGSSGATFVEFGGWEMPLHYGSTIAEHLAVRNFAGLFDVSHMGKLVVAGAGSRDLLNRLCANGVPGDVGRGRYTFLLDEDGRIIDDVIVTCLHRLRYLMVCNAGPRQRVLDWIRKHAGGEHVEDHTFRYACLALQGPRAARILQLLTPSDVGAIKPFGGTSLPLLLGERLGTGRSPPAPPEAMGWVAPDGPLGEGEGTGDVAYATRTGYTGEDGFELFPPVKIVGTVWSALLAAGRESGLKPAGLGARDTLRLEKGYLLSGQDFDGRQTPLECASERFVRWNHPFFGREALERQKARGDYGRLVGLVARERGVPRHGCEVVQDREVVGVVTSGTMSPVLGTGIALARLRPDVAAKDTSVEIMVRDRPLRADVTRPPFV